MHLEIESARAHDTVFLLMESRRYQGYDRWRRQFHALNRYLIARMIDWAEIGSPWGRLANQSWRGRRGGAGQRGGSGAARDAEGEVAQDDRQ